MYVQRPSEIKFPLLSYTKLSGLDSKYTLPLLIVLKGAPLPEGFSISILISENFFAVVYDGTPNVNASPGVRRV